MACEDLKKEHSPELIEEKARIIYEDYVSILSPREVRECTNAPTTVQTDVIIANQLRETSYIFSLSRIVVHVHTRVHSMLQSSEDCTYTRLLSHSNSQQWLYVHIIFYKFFPFSICQVSLDSRVREIINRNMIAPSQHTFDEAQLQIYTLMHRDSYPRFINSPQYKELLRTCGVSTSSPSSGAAGASTAPPPPTSATASASASAAPATAKPESSTNG